MMKTDFVLEKPVKTDYEDPDARHAIAYSDIRQRMKLAEDKDFETTICRVWLLFRESTDDSPSYLIDWRDETYKDNIYVKCIIHDAKEKLRQFKEVLLNQIWETAYDRYKTDWMAENGYTISALLDKLDDELRAGAVDIFGAFERVETKGFDGQIWDDPDTFFATTWQDGNWIQSHLPDSAYWLWRARRVAEE